jgi:hypothetical protein
LGGWARAFDEEEREGEEGEGGRFGDGGGGEEGGIRVEQQDGLLLPVVGDEGEVLDVDKPFKLRSPADQF